MADTKTNFEPASLNQDDKLQLIMEQNSQIREDLAKLNKKFNRFVWTSRIGTIINVLLILGPIIAGVIFFQPIMQALLGGYQDLLPPNVANELHLTPVK